MFDLSFVVFCIWVDVDVCFGVIKEIFFCVVECVRILLILVVN